MATPTKACPACGEAVPVASTQCRHCQHDFAVEQPGALPLTLRKRFTRMGARPDDFTDRELLFLTAHYTRSIYVLLVFVLLVSIAGGIAIFVAVQSIEDTSGF